MSTNINISVGDNKLLEQARLQQAASRQAQLEKEANQRFAAEATAERTKALAAQGKDANGNPLTGTSFQAPQVDRRPAANRFPSDPALLLVPTADFVGDEITAQTKTLKTKVFVTGTGQPNAVYSATGGPNGATALLHPGLDVNQDCELYYDYDTPYEELALVKTKSWTFEGYLRSGSYYSYVTIELSNIQIGFFWTYDFDPGFYFYVPGAEVEYLPYAASGISQGDWTHVAVVQAQNSFKCFIGGQLVFEQPFTTDPGNPNADRLVNGFKLVGFIDMSDFGGVTYVAPGVHGYRFTAGKALYTGNFTPPSSITSFA